MTDDLSEREIVRSLDLSPSLVKSHVEKLVQIGLVEEGEKKNSLGRMMTSYRLAGTSKSVGFPPRDYLQLSEALINSLRSSLGEDSARILLHDMGVRMGKNVAETLVSRTKVTTWDPATYAENFVNGFLAEMGLHPRVIKMGKKEVIYEERNCLFEDLAVKYPGLICDVLDEAVHEGIDGLGGTKTMRLKCKGHGDPVCEYRVRWQARARGLETKPEADSR